MPTRTRRGNGQGSVYKRGSDGRFVAQVTLPDGKQRSRYAATEREAKRLLRCLQRDVEAGTLVASTRLTFEAFAKTWLADIRPSVRYSTWCKYECMIRFHANPAFGHVRLAQLEPRHIQALYTSLDGKLSPGSIRYLHATIGRALGHALKWNYVSRNVAKLATPPRLVPRPPTTLDPEAAKRLLAAASGETHEALWVLALTSGMRHGELLALRWRDLDLDAGRLTVSGSLTRDQHGHLIVSEPKTQQSRRTVLLTRLAIKALRHQRGQQVVSRLMAGPAWQDLDFVFATGLGTALSPNEVRGRYFPRLLAKAGLPPIRFHDLRHSAATLLLGRSIPPKVVAEMLGHSVQILMATYAHVTPSMHTQAVETMDHILEGAR